MLQKFFFRRSELLEFNLFVMLSVTQAHNVLELAFQAWFPIDNPAGM
jgi:hypothetical protein